MKRHFCDDDVPGASHARLFREAIGARLVSVSCISRLRPVFQLTYSPRFNLRSQPTTSGRYRLTTDHSLQSAGQTALHGHDGEPAVFVMDKLKRFASTDLALLNNSNLSICSPAQDASFTTTDKADHDSLPQAQYSTPGDFKVQLSEDGYAV